MTMHPIAGIMPALFTPMHDDGRIDHEGVRKLVDRLFDAGVDGLYVGGSTGEGILLSVEERRSLTETVVEATRSRGALMVHVGAAATGDAITLARHAEEAGADAISAVPPFTFGKNRPGILAHYRALADSTTLPLYLYNIPLLTGVNVTQDMIEELAKSPNVRGMKFSSPDLYAESRIIRNVRDFKVFHGSDETLLYGLMVGAVGGIGMTYNFLPELYVAIFNAHRNGELEKANRLQHRAARFVDLFLNRSPGNEVGVGKALLQAYQPVAGGPARLPNLPADAEQLAELKGELEQEGLLGEISQTLLEL